MDWKGKRILTGTEINSSSIIHSLEGKRLDGTGVKEAEPFH